jgi:phosphohistidine phosphatase
MRLYLVQHGEAVAEDVDPARPLSETGRADVAKMARFLAAGGLRVAQVLHSGKLRAEQTAVLLAAAVAPGMTPVTRAGLNPKDPTDEIARAVSTWDRDAMLVGHLPFMAKLVSRLVAGREDAGVAAFHPGSVVCLERTEQQRWVIAWMVRPDVLPGPDRLGIFRGLWQADR